MAFPGAVVILSRRRVFADALAHTLARRGFSVTVRSRPLEPLLRVQASHGIPDQGCCVLDLGGGRAAELAQIRALRVARPELRLLLLAPQADHAHVASALSAGAAGVVEMVACVKAIQTDTVPPTINYQVPDPACDLDYVPHKARPLAMRVALSNSFGFGGTNACLALRRFE